MKKKVKAIWGVACYPLLYIIAQSVISVVFSFITGIMVGIKNANTITGMTPEEITELVLKNFNIQIPLLLTVIIIFPVMYLLLKNEWRSEGFWKTGRLNAAFIAICVASGICLNFFTIGALNLTKLTDLFPDYAELIDTVVGNNLALEILCVGLLIPFIEEVIFRGVVFSRLRKITKLPVAIIIQALLFALIHFNVLQSSYAFILGVVLGLALLWLGSVWASVAIHAAYNLTSLAIAYSIGENEVSTSMLIAMAVLGAAFSAIGLFTCYKHREGAYEVKNNN